MRVEHPGINTAGLPAADRDMCDARSDTIMGSPEAESSQLVAFALLLRLDLSPEHAVLFLREAPELRTPAEVWAWVEAIPKQHPKETMQ